MAVALGWLLALRALVDDGADESALHRRVRLFAPLHFADLYPHELWALLENLVSDTDRVVGNGMPWQDLAGSRAQLGELFCARFAARATNKCARAVGDTMEQVQKL
ncbi:unnamed protein product [Effrenium voratum]|nr:unnamed protein product [Effrenium voratum]CAJ1443693.1 unnamed protein product [Effrenium voratum]